MRVPERTPPTNGQDDVHEARRLRTPEVRLDVMIGLDKSCASARISRYETGIHQPPYALAQKLAAVLNIPPAYLYCEDENLAALIREWGKLSPRKRRRLMEPAGLPPG
ncbi:MAG: helix-turn-helix transcriptional regulator [Betaproteobacteria bacterium]|nr:helix-turn-helix transcriptional regulator [Betaproteobacteria bacterium]